MPKKETAKPVATPVKPAPEKKQQVQGNGKAGQHAVTAVQPTVEKAVAPKTAAKPEPIKEVKVPKTTVKTSVPYQPGYTPLEKRADTPKTNEPLVRYSDNELGEFRDLINKKLEAAKKELAYLQGLITRKDDMGGDDENAWTNMVFGAVGGSLSMGIGRAVNQAGYNLSNSQRVYKGVGKALFTGLTTPEIKAAEEQKIVLDQLHAEATKLAKLKNLAELTGDQALYDSISKRLGTISALSHLENGTFEDYKAHVAKVGEVISGRPRKSKIRLGRRK